VTVHACTIIARNYLPYARVLARSFYAQHPDGRFTVLMLDDVNKEIDGSAERFEVVRLDELPEDPAELHRMALYYDLVELATAIKPWLLQKLLEDGAPEVMYLDPDIRVYQPLDRLVALATSHDVVLTPHAVAPMPRDGRMVDETSVLAAGIYNLGFIALGRSSKRFLEYWKERLRFECIVAPERMRFVDQRWIDFVPGMFEVAVLRDPTYNVAYWNLDHRHLRWSGSQYEVDGGPLRFFHFSGYKPDVPHLLSHHQGDRPRILLSEAPDLFRLCNEYGAELLANGFGVDDQDPYGIDRLANGLPIDFVVRTYYRDWVTLALVGDTPPPPDPFDLEGSERLLAQLNEIAVADSGPSRLSGYHATRYAFDDELRAEFPDPQGGDYDRYATWTQSESEAGRLDPRLVLPASSELGPALSTPLPPKQPTAGARRHRPHPGVRVAGYLRAEMGVGQLGRLAGAAVEAAGIPVSHHVDRQTTSRQLHPFVHAVDDDMNVNLICVNADELPGFAGRVGPEFFESKYTIGLWAWEVSTFPERYAAAFHYVDEVWGCSRFTRDAIAAVSPKPVFAFAPPIIPPDPSPTIDRAALGIPDGPLFLFCFDLLSVMERKNPLGLIDAFTRAFAPGEGPVLVVKTVNGPRRVGDLERLRLAAAPRPDVVVLDRYLDYRKTTGLMAACECYVSLHRSEGFGLTMAEAMALGKPVVATGFSGNMDFMTKETAFLVPWSETFVPKDCDPYPTGSSWAQPDIEAAAALLRHVFEHPGEAGEVGQRARQAILTEHSLSARASFIEDRFAAAQETLRVRRRRRLARKVLPGPVRSVVRRVVSGGARPPAQGADSIEVEEDATHVHKATPRAFWSDVMIDRLAYPPSGDRSSVDQRSSP